MGGFTFRSLGPVGNNQISLKFFFWTDLSQYPLFWKPFLMNSLCIRFHQPLSLPIFRAICFRLCGNKSSRPHLPFTEQPLNYGCLFSCLLLCFRKHRWRSRGSFIRPPLSIFSVPVTWLLSILLQIRAFAVGLFPSSQLFTVYCLAGMTQSSPDPPLILSNYHYLHFSLSQLLTSLISAYRLIFCVLPFLLLTDNDHLIQVIHWEISNPGSSRIHM